MAEDPETVTELLKRRLDEAFHGTIRTYLGGPVPDLEGLDFYPSITSVSVEDGAGQKGSLTFEHLYQTYRLLQGGESVLRAVWCIDRPRFYTALIHMLDTQVRFRRSGADALAFEFVSPTGVPIHNWRLCELLSHINDLLTDAEEFTYVERQEVWDMVERNYPFRDAGVWLEMSRPPHRRLITPEDGVADGAGGPLWWYMETPYRAYPVGYTPTLETSTSEKEDSTHGKRQL